MDKRLLPGQFVELGEHTMTLSQSDRKNFKNNQRKENKCLMSGGRTQGTVSYSKVVK